MWNYNVAMATFSYRAKMAHCHSRFENVIDCDVVALKNAADNMNTWKEE